MPCAETQEFELASVALTATMFMAEEEDNFGFVVFTFDWAGQARAAVPFSMEVESPAVEWHDETTATYVHGNDTTETDVRVYRHFTAEAAVEEIEMRFNVTAHQGTSEQESWTGTLHFEEGGGNGTVTEEEGGVTETAVVSGMFGALIGAILAAVVIVLIRKT